MTAGIDGEPDVRCEWKEASAAQVRDAIARGSPAAAALPRLGRVELRPHQAEAVERLRGMIARDGGALLADDAGLGKTYVAAALAADARSPLIAAPASLREMWHAALEETTVGAAFVSFEQLGRGGWLRGDHDLVVLDEAHHARTPGTRRYRALAALTARASVLLLSATPIHNRRRDLESLLALFLGERTAAMSDVELGSHILRRDRESVDRGARPPAASRPTWLPLAHDDALLDALLALPPPLPPSDGGDGGALLVHSLVRQWASSDGALRRALERRSATAAALLDSLSVGRYPTRAELREWTLSDGAVQLAFPELMASECEGDHRLLLETVIAHDRAVRGLRHRLRSRPALDASRAARIRETRRHHVGEKVVAFTAYADTAAALYHQLRGDPGVAVLSARGARVAGGTLTRREAIARFAPSAQGVRPPPASERIDLLITTDLLSEGMNLQDASVVIHIDLPWTPARMEQRVGRAARIGSPRERVAVYALAPPASAERMIAVERRLHEKQAVVRRALGTGASILPLPLVPRPGPERDEQAATTVRQAFGRWRSHADAPVNSSGGAPIAAVRSPIEGFLAALETPDGPVLIARLAGNAARDPRAEPSSFGPDGTASAQPTVLAAAAVLAEGASCGVQPASLASALRGIDRWLSDRRAANAAGALAVSPVARRIERRIGEIAARTPAHRRPAIAALAANARAASARPLGIGAERELAGLLGAALGDEAWLAAVAAFASARNAGLAAGAAIGGWNARLAALLLLQATEGGAS